MRRLPVLFLAAGVVACSMDAENPVSPVLAPEIGLEAPAAPGTIPGRFIVTVRDGFDPEAVAGDHGVAPEFVYHLVLNGFAGAMSDAARSGLLRDARVRRVEPDGVATVVAGVSTETAASWGLDRIDQRALPMDGHYSYETTAGAVHAYILDTGIRYSHQEFGGRAVQGYDAFGGDGSDCHGHGTHVAGTVGGAKYGVAKGVTLVAVRVLDCNGSGSWSGVIAGMDWVAGHNANTFRVANMSLGGSSSSSVDEAVTRMYDKKVAVVVAAGNGNIIGRAQDACKYSPAGAPRAYTVGATEKDDRKTSWSNYGNCVDIFAPGRDIVSAWHQSNTDTRTLSGTSMASPHVAGVAALWLANKSPGTTQDIYDAVTANSTKNIVASSSTANNHLVYSLWGTDGGNGGDSNAPPSASFTYSCTDLACDFTDTSTDDGSIVAWSWKFGDSATSTAQHPTHTYASGGTYSVELTVTDDDGAIGSTSQSLTVTAPANGDGDGFTLSVNAYKVRGRKHADLGWSGTTSTNVDVYRDGALVVTVTNSGSYTHSTNEVGGGSHTYRVCEANTNTCSNEAVASY